MDCQTSTEIVISVQEDAGSIALVGHPNVGKSALFQRLTGQRVMVSNYPGTTVEVTRGKSRLLPGFELVDTPGVITFPPHSDDEQVTARILFDEPVRAILQVGDAKNLRRTLLLAVQLAETGKPLVLCLNMMDEVKARGMSVDHKIVAEQLGLPVVPTVAVHGDGISELGDAVLDAAINNAGTPDLTLEYPQQIETAVGDVIAFFERTGISSPPISARSLALLWLSGDPVSETWLEAQLNDSILATEYAAMTARRASLQSEISEPLASQILQTRLSYVEKMVDDAVVDSDRQRQNITSRLSRLTTHPVWGWFILGAVLYALFWFVGIFGAGTLVGLFEEWLFGQALNPWVVNGVRRLITIPFWADLIVGEYGLWTMGMTYALALILPIVSTFFLAFGVMEDSGYLPRLAVLSNRMFQGLGLNGKAVLPMVLGLGCVTMATLTTRVLESKRERLLVILLLALAVPCSAQLGVIMGMLAGISLTATLIWSGVIVAVLLTVGWLAARLVPGERTMLLVELPPLRWPLISNVVMKTLARLEWYLKEVVPLFLAGTLVMFILDRVGALAWLTHAAEPLVTGWLGLPPEASSAFLMGFLRRDFGATGLFIMEAQGLLTPAQVIVAMVTVTLFVPCIASVMMIAKESSWRTTIAIIAFIFPLAFLVGGLLHQLFVLIGWGVV
ncbi:ferrous iron transport protein B [Chloroflexota bacterium]